MRAVLARVPPPLLFVVPLLVGLRLHRTYAQALAPPALAAAGGVVGWGLVVLGVTIAATSVAMFIQRRTTIVPHRRARSLVTGGPFRFSRNPMYVALTSAYLGVTLVANSAWPLLLLAVPLLCLQAVTIPSEERMLRDAFGAEYRGYSSRVRRWL
jgi:protein-S-isoprenylcysteine O-methyltransferase Ste14